jgi:hypothetical protein
LLKEYDKLWVFGDSFTTPNICVSPKDSFWGLAASHLNVKHIINCSWPSNSFDSVYHVMISLQEQYNWDNDIFFIGIPPLWRLTIFDNYKDTRYNGYNFNTSTWDSAKFEISCHTGLENFQVGEDKLLTIFEDRSWTETETMRTIFLLTNWLDSKNARYLIYNLSDPLDINNKWGPSNFLLPYCIKHKNCILFEGTYYSVNVGVNIPPDANSADKWRGHHGPAGNKLFFEKSIKPKLEELFC